MSKAVKEANIEEVIKRPYKLRKLKDSDLFPLLQLLRKLGLKDFKDAFIKEIKEKPFDPDAYENKEEANIALDKLKDEEGIDVFISMADMIIQKIDSHSDDIYEFYASLSGVTADEIKDMEFGTLPLMIYDSFNEVKNTSFFKVLSKLL